MSSIPLNPPQPGTATRPQPTRIVDEMTENLKRLFQMFLEK